MRVGSSAAIALAALTALAGCEHEERAPSRHPAEAQQPSGIVRTKGSPDGAQPKIDAKAEELLKRMSDYLANTKAFSLTSDSSLEVVRKSGQKVEFNATSRVSVKRPNKLRSDRKGELVDASFIYDGKTMTIFGKKKNLYAQAAAPDNLDAAIDFAREKLDLEAPGADLLFSNPYEVLTADANAGAYIGETHIDGVLCDHLAFRGTDVDWQIWIQKDGPPLPRKYLINTKDVKGNPEFTVMLHDWDTTTAIPDDLFSFAPPKGAQKIEFMSQALGRKKQQ